MKSASTIFLVSATVLVAAAIVAGIWVMGGPGLARLRAYDVRRIDALQAISSSIDQFRRQRGVLPNSIFEVAQEEGGLSAPGIQDPETGAPYEYRKLGEGAYELCARFAAPSDPQGPIRWRHGRGRTCFSFAAGAPPRPA